MLLISILVLNSPVSQALSLSNSENNSQETQSDFLPVEQAFPFTVSKKDTDSSHIWKISWNASKGYYLYQKSIKLVTDNPEPDSSIITTFSKEPEIKYDPNFEKDVAIFKHELSVEFSSPRAIANPVLHFQGCAEAGLCYPLQSVHLATFTESNNSKKDQNVKNNQFEFNTASEPPAFQHLLNDASLWKISLVFFLFGIGLCLTPCVLPMIPIISGLVMGRDKALSTRQAFSISSTYVLAMSLCYTIIGVLAASLGASANIQIWMQTPWVLSLFAALFMILSLSMFDVYELRLPQLIQQKLDDLSRQQQGGDYIGAAIMGVLSALVVSPCVSAPLAGALIFISSTGETSLGAFALFSLGLGMGAPMIALCTFGSSFLPKAGAWMNLIKRLFGLLLLAVAIWMLARFLEKQIVLALWGALFVFASFSLGSWQKSNSFIKVTQILLLLWGVISIVGASLGNSKLSQPLENLVAKEQIRQMVSPKNHEDFQIIHSLTDLDNELEKNKGSGKILLLDFYADWCTSCKEIEENIFKNPEFETSLSRFYLVQADLSLNSTDNFKLLEKFELFGPPAMLFFDPKGNEIKNYRIQGVVTPDNFRNILKQMEEPSP